MYIGHLIFQPEPLFCPYNLREPFPTPVVVSENAATPDIFLTICNHRCSLVLLSLPLSLASLTKSIGGIPHLSKTNIRILLVLFSPCLVPSLCALPLAASQPYCRFSLCPSAQIMRLLVGLLGDPNQHERVRAVKTYKGESPGEVADPLVTLSPRGVAAALAVCVSVQSVEQMAGVLGREQQVSACMSPG